MVTPLERTLFEAFLDAGDAHAAVRWGPGETEAEYRERRRRAVDRLRGARDDLRDHCRRFGAIEVDGVRIEARGDNLAIDVAERAAR